MARKLNDQALAVINSMVIDGATNGAIHRALTSGNAGLEGPITIGKRTIEMHAARFRLAAKPEVDPLQDANEVDAIDAIQRELIRTAKREVDRIRDRSKQGKATPLDLKNMRDYSRVLQELRRHFLIAKTTASEKGGTNKHRADESSPQSTLERLTEQGSAPLQSNGHQPASETTDYPQAPSVSAPLSSLAPLIDQDNDQQTSTPIDDGSSVSTQHDAHQPIAA